MGVLNLGACDGVHEHADDLHDARKEPRGINEKGFGQALGVVGLQHVEECLAVAARAW